LVDLTDFALALRQKLEAMNAESFNNFELRVGKRKTEDILFLSYFRERKKIIIRNNFLPSQQESQTDQ